MLNPDVNFLSVKYASLIVFDKVDFDALYSWYDRTLSTVDLLTHKGTELKDYLDYEDPFEVAETLNQIARSYVAFHVGASFLEAFTDKP